MANELKFWDKVTGFKYPNGKEVTAEEVFAEFPFTKDANVKVLLEYLPDGSVGAIDNLDILKTVYNITDTTLTDAQVVAKIIEIRNAPPAPAPVGVSPEELRADLDYLLMTNGEVKA